MTTTTTTITSTTRFEVVVEVEVVREQSVDENIWTFEKGSDTKLENNV
jgi:hypothetical protein